MSEFQVLISQLVKVGIVVVLLAVALRRRDRDCWSFPVYLVLVLIGDTLVSVWPDRFYVAWFWYLQQSLWDVAKLCIALEIAFRAFRVFPGARPVVQALLVLVMSGTTAAIVSLPSRLSHDAVVFDWEPRVLTGTIWLMTAVTMVVVYYRLPIRSFQLAILTGFVPYLLVFVTLLNVLRHHGWQLRPWINAVDATAYLAVVLYWSWAAWRREEATAASRVTLKRLGLEHA